MIPLLESVLCNDRNKFAKIVDVFSVIVFTFVVAGPTESKNAPLVVDFLETGVALGMSITEKPETLPKYLNCEG